MPDGSIVKPEHSPLGGSSAERWMNCPGSQALIAQLGSGADDTPEYQIEGTNAHALAAACLTNGTAPWEEAPDFLVSAEMSQAVQTYLDYANSRPPGSRRLVEHAVEHTRFHPLMYGRLDLAILDPEPNVALEIIDYKHGAGVIVDHEHNVQERYYAYCFISGDTWPADIPRLEDMARIKLTIVQPRGHHPEGPVRSCIVAAAEIRNWAYNELLPAMQRAATTLAFNIGDHCQFCPAKLICPPTHKMMEKAADCAGMAEAIPHWDDEIAGKWYGLLPRMKGFIKALEDDAKRRALNGVERPEWKLVYGITDRIWKEGAPIETTFGEEAWEHKLRSPAQIEKLGPAGKEFCAEYATKPEGALTIAPTSDKRAAQKPRTNEQVFAGFAVPETW